jgi:hypothetical protein
MQIVQLQPPYSSPNMFQPIKTIFRDSNYETQKVQKLTQVNET